MYSHNLISRSSILSALHSLEISPHTQFSSGSILLISQCTYRNKSLFLSIRVEKKQLRTSDHALQSYFRGKSVLLLAPSPHPCQPSICSIRAAIQSYGIANAFYQTGGYIWSAQRPFCLILLWHGADEKISYVRDSHSITNLSLHLIYQGK